MKIKTISAAAAFALVACGQQQSSETQASAPVTEAAQTYSGTGKVTDIANDKITIAHGPIEGIGWPAMTMTFAAPGDMTRRVEVGNEVTFSFRQNGSSYELTNISNH